MGTNLGDLLAKAGMKASAQAPTTPEPAAEEAAPDAIRFAAKVVLRRSKKGRGGRTVTLIQGVLAGRDTVASALKKQLGVGVRVEGESLVLQGDQVERVARWVESQDGVKKVVRG